MLEHRTPASATSSHRKEQDEIIAEAKAPRGGSWLANGQASRRVLNFQKITEHHMGWQSPTPTLSDSLRRTKNALKRNPLQRTPRGSEARGGSNPP